MKKHIDMMFAFITFLSFSDIGRATPSLNRVVAFQQAEITRLKNSITKSWFECGTLNELDRNGLEEFSHLDFEYGIHYNSSIRTVTMLRWGPNGGFKVANKFPYMVSTDEPNNVRENPMAWGGFIFYRDTQSPQDNACVSPAPFRHRYWKFNEKNIVELFGESDGCSGVNIKVYCKRR